eukprot:scaffold39572_cov68-Phaeocystis_antarctica.AAC.8
MAPRFDHGENRARGPWPCRAPRASCGFARVRIPNDENVRFTSTALSIPLSTPSAPPRGPGGGRSIHIETLYAYM